MRFARDQLETADRGNARESFPAEAKGLEPEQVVQGVDLTGRVPFDGEQRIIGAHPRTVVHDRNLPAAPRQKLNRYLCASGIDAVFHQFLDHRRGSFDHFAGSNLIADNVWKHGDLCHGDSFHRRGTVGALRGQFFAPALRCFGAVNGYFIDSVHAFRYAESDHSSRQGVSQIGWLPITGRPLQQLD